MLERVAKHSYRIGAGLALIIAGYINITGGTSTVILMTAGLLLILDSIVT